MFRESEGEGNRQTTPSWIITIITSLGLGLAFRHTGPLDVLSVLRIYRRQIFVYLLLCSDDDILMRPGEIHFYSI